MSDSAKNRKKILVPVDFSEHSRRALARALELARVLDASVALLHVIDTHSVIPTTKGSQVAVEIGHFTTKLVDEGKTKLRALARETDPSEKLVSITEVLEGRPWQVILHVASAIKPDMIVMGKRGHGIDVGTGSVAERVVRGASCDVLVVRES